jgi:hypothetical protein
MHLVGGVNGDDLLTFVCDLDLFLYGKQRIIPLNKLFLCFFFVCFYSISFNHLE